ncbi:hypothetical protein [Melittangium boletus]|uniref:Lipoprotein n=1 Tax=Melittangium boletus DSM 14713 TaxID=1294270 RepID=A0A250IDT8_9BACT|nr:hypothetical protein [Melittangium boletus]ATB29403.1 hypothetical protein MEBOL_002852 [Melittangium boletus DSM 14713]
MNTPRRRWLPSALVLMSLSACGGDPDETNPTPVEPNPPRSSTCDQAAFDLANLDAQTPTQAEISTNLFAISQSNPKVVWNGDKTAVRMVVWTTYGGYTAGTNTLTRDLFLTPAPQLQEACKAWGLSGNELVARINQYLGLTPATEGDYQNRKLVEMWVKPSALFRPCADQEVDDSTCGLTYPASATSAHKSWLNNYWGGSYSPWLTTHYPFTGLGYTYDWCSGETTHVGASEYVVLTGNEVDVVGYTTAAEYCAK